MFGTPALPPPTSTDSEPERENEKEIDKKNLVTSLLSETVSIFLYNRGYGMDEYNK